MYIPLAFQKHRLISHSYIIFYAPKNNLFREAKPTDRMFRRVKTVEEAWELSLYYKTMTELSNHASKAYSILKENGLLERRYPNSINYAIKEEFTFEDCKKVYAKFANVSEVEKRYRKIHRVAKEKGLSYTEIGRHIYNS